MILMNLRSETMNAQPARKRMHFFAFTIGTIALGLGSRTSAVPDFIYPYLGDALYALMIFFILGFLFRKATSFQLLALAIIICFSIELSQLYQADWINAIRRTRLGALVLGSGFLWSDFAAYLVGSLLGFSFEKTIYFTQKEK